MNDAKENKGQIAGPGPIADPALETRIGTPGSKQLQEMAAKRRIVDFTQGATGAGPADYNEPPKTIYPGLYR
ncbi:hypothetical protein HYU09_01500 [Candidatus Woesearchaeota archaeon]|nr:hypothetical protein [Candidatus Woesearchaeota archaeon]